MLILRSKLTSKFQTTIPKKVRNTLHLAAHDQIIYEITDNNEVILRKATPLNLDYVQALNYVLTEWDSKKDEAAYNDL